MSLPQDHRVSFEKKPLSEVPVGARVKRVSTGVLRQKGLWTVKDVRGGRATLTYGPYRHTVALEDYVLEEVIVKKKPRFPPTPIFTVHVLSVHQMTIKEFPLPEGSRKSLEARIRQMRGAAGYQLRNGVSDEARHIRMPDGSFERCQ